MQWLWVAGVRSVALPVLILVLCPLHVVGRCLYHFDSRVSPSGNLSSPGWPTQYPAGLRCTYVFQGEMFQAVQITFHSFELEEPYKAGCLADYLDITTVDITGVKEFVGRYCGGEVVNPLLTLHPRLELLFVSNLAVQAKGFTASFTYMHEEAVRPAETVVSGREMCGGIVEGAGGRLTSPGYPFSFPGGLSCTWLLRARPHFHVYLRIQELQLQGSIANCRRAELAIHDGYRPVGHVRESLKVFCGDLNYYRNQADKEVLSERNRLLITFRTGESSDNNTKIAGFLLIWTEVSLTTPGNCSRQEGFTCPRSVYCVGVAKDGGCLSTANLCIHRGLVCDGQPNCSVGDGADEAECPAGGGGGVAAVAVAVAAGVCGAVAAVGGVAVLGVRWRRARLSNALASSFTSQNLVTSSPSVLSPLFPNNVAGTPDVSVEAVWMEPRVPTPPPPPFLVPPLTHSRSDLQHPLPDLSLIASTLPPPPPLADYQTQLPDLSNLPPPPATPPDGDVQSLMTNPSTLPSEWPSVPSIMPMTPPSPLPSERLPWLDALPDPITRSPEREEAKREASSYSGPEEQPPTTESVDPPVSTNDAESSGSHASSQLSTFRSLSTTSTIQDVARLQLSDTTHTVSASIGYDKSQRDLGILSPMSPRKHHSHCPYATVSHPSHPRCGRRVHPCSHHMSQYNHHIPPWSRHCDHQLQRYGLGRSHSLPRNRSLIRSRSESPHESRPWPLTPEVRRRLSYFDRPEDDRRDMESPLGSMCFPCVSTPSREVSKISSTILDHHDGSYHRRAHWLGSRRCSCRPHHHCASSHTCHGAHASVFSSSEHIY